MYIHMYIHDVCVYGMGTVNTLGDEILSLQKMKCECYLENHSSTMKFYYSESLGKLAILVM